MDLEDEINRRFSYDPKTGKIIYKIKGRRKNIGDSFGHMKNDGYICGKIGGRKLVMHRVALFLHYGNWPIKNVEHINGNLSDNRIENLREFGTVAGKRDHPDYSRYKGMLKRSRNPGKHDKKYYSGVTVSQRWQKSFWNFVEDMGPAPTASHTLDRIDNNKGYSKKNCRWATHREQTLNRDIVKYRCKFGHPWTKESTKWTHNGSSKSRRCKICLSAYHKKRALEAKKNDRT